MTELKIGKRISGMKQVIGFVMAFCLAAAPVGGLTTVHANQGGASTQQTADQTYDQAPIKVSATSVVLNKAKANVYKGKSTKLKATMAPSNTTDSITWTSSNTKVATVKDGIVKGIKKGTATITATTTSGKTATCKVTVKTVATKSIKLNKSKVTIKKGKTATLKTSIKPKTSTDSLVWKTSNKKVVTVTSKGVIKGIKAGKATITVKAGKKTAKCVVTVKAVKATSVKLNKKKVTTTVGKTITLKLTVKPSNTTDSIVWSTSNKKVATVKAGVVTAVGKGTATITAKVGNKSVKCKITVKVPAKSVALDQQTLKVKVGSTATLKATVAPSNTTDKITWTTSDKKVVKVSTKGVVKGIKKGTATITAKTESGKTATCLVTVE